MLRSRAVVAFLVGALALLVVPQARACYTCTVTGGCNFALPGFMFCYSDHVGDVPYCVAWGACTFPGGGDGGDVLPRLARKTLDQAPAAGGAGELRVHGLILAARGGRDLPAFTPGVLRATGGRGDPAEILRDAARHMGLPPGRIVAANAGTHTGPGHFDGVFAAPDGSGYAIRAETAGDGASISVCAVLDRATRAPLFSGSLGGGDLLVAPIRVGGSACALVLRAAPSGRASGGEERVDREGFPDRARGLIRAGGHPGLRLEIVEGAMPCR